MGHPPYAPLPLPQVLRVEATLSPVGVLATLRLEILFASSTQGPHIALMVRLNDDEHLALTREHFMYRETKR